MRKTALAQLVELYAECRGVTTTAELAQLTGYSERAIWKAKAELRYTEPECTLNHSSVNQSAETCTGVQGASRAHKLYEENIKITPNPLHQLELTEPQPKPKAARKRAVMDGFDRFWEIYPRKTGKAAAERKWPQAIARAGSAETIIDGLQAQLPALRSREIQYIPHPSTWLNAARWEDETSTQKKFTAEDLNGKSRTEIMRMMRAH